LNVLTIVRGGTRADRQTSHRNHFMQPLRLRWRLLDRLGKLRRDEARKGRGPLVLASARQTGLDGLRGRSLNDM
jgi:hypothetical protein